MIHPKANNKEQSSASHLKGAFTADTKDLKALVTADLKEAWIGWMF